MKTREEIITSMCYTWRHDYGIDRQKGVLVGPGLSQRERENLWNQMAQVFDNCIAPHMEIVTEDIKEYVMNIELVKERMNKRPAKKGYHPNGAPYKVIVNNKFIKREYPTKEKAENYALTLSAKYPNWTITVEYIKIPTEKGNRMENEHKKEMKRRYEFLKSINAPQEVIDQAERDLDSTHEEYQLRQKQIEEEIKQEKIDYAKNNPIRKEVVDEIHSRMEKLPYDYTTSFSPTSFYVAIDPISIMGENDFINGLYDDVLTNAQKLYREKYKDEIYKKG